MHVDASVDRLTVEAKRGRDGAIGHAKAFA
jgi:hypothetical protein